MRLNFRRLYGGRKIEGTHFLEESLVKSCVFQRAEGALFALKLMHLGILRGMLMIPIHIRSGNDEFWDLFWCVRFVSNYVRIQGDSGVF